MRPMDVASDRYIRTDISSLEQFEQFQKKHANSDVTKVSSDCNNCALQLHDVNFVVVPTSACSNIYRLASSSCNYSTLSWV